MVLKCFVVTFVMIFLWCILSVLLRCTIIFIEFFAICEFIWHNIHDRDEIISSMLSISCSAVGAVKSIVCKSTIYSQNFLIKRKCFRVSTSHCHSIFNLAVSFY